jgi:hypothetical protein
VFESILIGLASDRLWRLLAQDAILDDARDWVLVRSPRWVEEMVECSWCLGSTLTFGVTWATDAVAGLPMPVLVGLAAAVVVGWLGSVIE